MRPASNDITAGIAKVSAYLNGSWATPSPYHDNLLPGPLVYVTANLDFFHNEISNYFWKRNPQGEWIDEPIDRNDHAMDTIKYGLAKLPDPSEIVIPKSVIAPEWMFWHEMN